MIKLIIKIITMVLIIIGIVVVLNLIGIDMIEIVKKLWENIWENMKDVFSL